MTYREIIYMSLDQIKAVSDDSYFTVEHVLSLVSKIRALILKQRYSDIKKEVPHSNYQTICLPVEPITLDGSCNEVTYLKTTSKVPSTMSIGATSIYPVDYYQGVHITYISRERMKYVGNNKWLKNIIYVSKGPDGYLYFKSSNPQFLYLEKVNMTGIFEDPLKADELKCELDNIQCDILNREFPLEESLISTVIELTVKYLAGAIYRPKDETNNASDDLSDIMAFIRRNMKSNFQKQLDADE